MIMNEVIVNRVVHCVIMHRASHMRIWYC